MYTVLYSIIKATKYGTHSDCNKNVVHMLRTKSTCSYCSKMVEELGGPEFIEFLEENGIPPSVCDDIVENSSLTGRLFMLLTEADLAELCPKLGDKILVRELLNKLRKVSA